MEITKKKLGLLAAVLLAGLFLVPGVSAAIVAFIAQFMIVIFGAPTMPLTAVYTNVTPGTIVNGSVDLTNVSAGSTVHLMGTIHNSANNDLNTYWMEYHFDNDAHDFVGSPWEFIVSDNWGATYQCIAAGQMYAYSSLPPSLPAGSDTAIFADVTMHPQYQGNGTVMQQSLVAVKKC